MTWQCNQNLIKIGVGGVALVSVIGWLLYQYHKRKQQSIDHEKVLSKKCERSKIILMGLPQSGKTTLLASLTGIKIPNEYIPTEGFNAKTIFGGASARQILEVGGAPQLQEYWAKFLPDAIFIIFTIAATSQKAVVEQEQSLIKLLKQHEERLDVVIIITRRLPNILFNDLCVSLQNEVGAHAKSVHCFDFETDHQNESLIDISEFLLKLSDES